MDTDALLQPIQTAKDQLDALEDIVEANTAAFNEIRKDLGQCNNQEKVQAIIDKVEKARTDLAIDSQKIPKWVRERNKDGLVVQGAAVGSGSAFYGQYIVNQPLNPDNPVPWPPGYTPSGSSQVQTQKQGDK